MSTALVVKLPALAGEVEIAADWRARRDEIVSAAAAIQKVESQREFELAEDMAAQATKHSNALEKVRKSLSDPFRRAAEKIKAASDQERAPLETTKSALRRMTEPYAQEQRRRAAEEARRIEAEKQAEIEKQLAAREVEEELGLADAQEVFEPVEPDIPATIMPAVADTTASVDRIEWDLVNLDAVPRMFLMLDPRKVNDWRTRYKEDITAKLEGDPAAEILPGIRFRLELRLRSRGR